MLFSAQDVIIDKFLLDKKEFEGVEYEDIDVIKQRDLHRLYVMEGYCKTTGCLRNYILNYFGENVTGVCGNCGNITDAAKPVEYIKFENGKEIYQDINYVVAANQTLTVNTQASAVFDASIGRDVDAMIEAVKFAQDANNKVEELEKMQKMQEYSSDDCQAALEDWIAAAKKERDYADDNLQKLYNSYIGNFDDYLQKVNLANTDLGSKGQSLDLTKNRMANQQTTMEELKSTNEDRDLSEIIIDYTSAYTAYQASLQAAAKINQTTLLNYI